MSTSKAFRDTTMLLLEETFIGSDKGGNVYLDTGTGWQPTLAQLSAVDASTRLTPSGTTPAGHVFHTIFYMDVVMAELYGKQVGRIDWRESWVVGQVDEGRWADLKNELIAKYEELVAQLEGAGAWGDAETEVPMAVMTHSAYHLGAVRQFLTVTRK